MHVQKGFTLIELVFVIVIVGILAAFAIPRFVDLTTDARQATVRGVQGSVRAAADMAKGAAIAQQKDDDATATILVEGVATNIAYGYPTAAAGIGSIVEETSEFTLDTSTANVAEFELAAADTPDNCKVIYTWAAAENGRPTVTTDLSDC